MMSLIPTVSKMLCILAPGGDMPPKIGTVPGKWGLLVTLFNECLTVLPALHLFRTVIHRKPA